MRPRSLFWKLFLASAVTLAAVLTVSGVLVARGFFRLTTDELNRQLDTAARWLARTLEEPLALRDPKRIEEAIQWPGECSAMPVSAQVFDAQGRRLSASGAYAAADPAESALDVRQALTDGRHETTRWSHASASRIRLVAARVGPVDTPLGVVWIAAPADYVSTWMRPARRLVWALASGSVVAALMLALAIAYVWSRRLRRISAAARRFSRGDLSARVEVSGSDETAALARSLNELRDSMAYQLDTIDRQRRTLSSLVSQLREGVLVTGPDGRLVLVNPEAVRQLQLVSPRTDGSFEGLTVEQCIPQHDVQELLRGDGDARRLERLGAAGTPAENRAEYQESKLQVDGPDGPVSLLARACDISLPTAERILDDETEPARAGRLLVLTDITELARAMQVKADFAANASHELRTPLAAILAATETIRGLDHQSETTALRHFLAVIERHSRRMQAMVADLLDLSRLESALTRFEPVRIRFRDIATEMHDEFADSIEAKSLSWHVDIAQDCQELYVNPDLIRMVLRNLLENAIRYTPTGGRVELSVQRSDGGVRVRVADTGCGIPLSEQGRVFERFYQVERARSGGADRGTGLGLSIVRHAVAAMLGTVELESTVGSGTQITVTIPQAA